ncbi:MAG TPA: Gfo/Idh/MocA family oxidoreductase [Ardenticatenaceae bacterium]|nr:Gfo/Idh/MocA family oxidoreductase [Ardenticatenaceae bacterium]
MPRAITAGLVGCGAVALYGVLPQLSLPDVKERLDLVALCDVVAERAEAAAAKFGVPQAYADVGEMLARADVELVIVTTPIPYHYSIALQALTAGRHVYVQKTMTTTLAEARHLIETARQRGLTLAAAPGQMLSPAFQKMREFVQAGELGKVYWAIGATSGFGHENESTRQGTDVLSNVDPTWYYRPGGGPVADVAVYMLHSLTGVLGPARRVTAMSGVGLKERPWGNTTIPVQMDDNTVLLLDHGDATFSHAGGHHCVGGPLLSWGTMGIYGSHGSVEAMEIEPYSGHPTRLTLTRHGSGNGSVGAPSSSVEIYYTPPTGLPHVTPAHMAVPEPHVYADIMHVVDCILDGGAPIPSAEHAAHVVEIIEKGYIAGRTGQTQELESTF